MFFQTKRKGSMLQESLCMVKLLMLDMAKIWNLLYFLIVNRWVLRLSIPKFIQLRMLLHLLGTLLIFSCIGFFLYISLLLECWLGLKKCICLAFYYLLYFHFRLADPFLAIKLMFEFDFDICSFCNWRLLLLIVCETRLFFGFFNC